MLFPKMCNCTTNFDIRCRCTPYNTDYFYGCPVRVDTAVWLLDNNEELHTKARKRDFTILREWGFVEEDIRNAELIYVNDMIEEMGYDESEEALLWKQKQIEIRLRLLVIQARPMIKCTGCEETKRLFTYAEGNDSLPMCEVCFT